MTKVRLSSQRESSRRIKLSGTVMAFRAFVSSPEIANLRGRTGLFIPCCLARAPPADCYPSRSGASSPRARAPSHLGSPNPSVSTTLLSMLFSAHSPPSLFFPYSLLCYSRFNPFLFSSCPIPTVLGLSAVTFCYDLPILRLLLIFLPGAHEYMYLGPIYFSRLLV
jgi:hypothetical protein